MEVGNQTWTLGTTLKIKQGDDTNTSKNASSAAVGNISEENVETAGTSKDVDPDEALRFLFKAIDHFGKNTQVIKQVQKINWFPTRIETVYMYFTPTNL